MLPPAASLATPSVALVQAMLTRARLPLNTVALAVCILDSLDSRFARAWRLTCPLGAPASPSLLSAPPPSEKEKRHTLPSPLSPAPALLSASVSDADRLFHIDAVFPEIIILAALAIAAKFIDDGFSSQQFALAYCPAGGPVASASPASAPASALASSCGLWTAAQLAATERCIMQNLGYRILPLLDADLLADAQADMRRAGVQALRPRTRTRTASTATTPMSPRKAHAAAAIMTPPGEEAVADLPGTTARAHPAALPLRTQGQRRHHAPSHSECFGRLAAYERG